MTTTGHLTRAAMDVLPINVAILDDAGTIVETNQSWREFGESNDVTVQPDSVGLNYFTVADGSESKAARRALTGLREVIEGERDVFTLEYPCHSPSERRWFLLWAAPFPAAGPPRRRSSGTETAT